MEMGFSENESKRAALATNNTGANEGMDWVLSHMNDPDFNDPLPAPSSSKPDTPSTTTASSSKKPIPQEALNALSGRGFTSEQGENALLANDTMSLNVLGVAV